MSGAVLATYPWIVKRMPGILLAASSAPAAARAAARRAWHGLVPVLIGADPPPVWQWSSSQQRQVAYSALGVATVALCAANLAGIATVGQLLVAVPVVAPLPLAARYPMLAWRIGWLALLLTPLVPAAWRGGWPWGPGQILALLGAFCLAGVRQQRPELWWMWALTLIPWWLWLAVLEERTRIARELHDVVAHHMSLIAVRAETAPYRLSGLPESAQAEFGSLSEVAREALAEMRRLLGVLRQDQPADLAPQPSLADVPSLVGAARQAGLAVELSVPPALDHVPSGVGVCAYRIVQESLSNASQHAPGAAVTVSVGRDSGAVLLRVANGPGWPGGSSENHHGPGHGLTGMRERVALLGGSLSAEPSPDGGFVVSAVLPLGHTA